MRYLYHNWISPESRLVRLILAEKSLSCILHPEPYWLARPGFLRLSPEGNVPLLIEVFTANAPVQTLQAGTDPFEETILAISQMADLSDTTDLPDNKQGFAVTGLLPLLDYLNSQYPEKSLSSDNVLVQIEIQRLFAYCYSHFYRDCVQPLILEKIIKRYDHPAATDSVALRTAKQNLPIYLAYLDKLIKKRYWLAGDKPSLADFAAGAGISCLDYLSEIIWSNFPDMHDWYRRLKSRPAFHPLLEDQHPQISGPSWYQDLDF